MEMALSRQCPGLLAVWWAGRRGWPAGRGGWLADSPSPPPVGGWVDRAIYIVIPY